MVVLYSPHDQMWKLADFGISAEGTSRMARPTHYSRGTSCWRAPELLKDQAYYTNRSDIWALGCILYLLVCCKRPFEGDWDTFHYSGNLVINMVPIELVSQDVLAGITALIQKMLQTAPHQRPSARIVHETITTLTYRILHHDEFMQREGSDGPSGGSNLIPSPKSIKVPEEITEGQYYGVAAKFGELVKAREEEYGEDEKTADLHFNLASVLLSQGRSEDALKEFKQALAIYEEELGIAALRVGDVAASLGRVYQELGELTNAIEQLERAVGIYNQRLEPQDEKTVSVMSRLADVYGEYANLRRRSLSEI